jgi:Trk-type K+ transport system membrane component
MRLSLVVHVIGLIVRVFGLMFLTPAAVAAAYGEYRDAQVFVLAAAVTSAARPPSRRWSRCAGSKAWRSSPARG